MGENEIINSILSKSIHLFESLTGALLIFALVVLLLAIAVLVIIIIGEAKLFKKAGKPGWAAIIPFYNIYVLVEISGLNWWYFLIAISGTIFSILGIHGLGTITWIASGVANFFIFYNLGKKFQKDPIIYGILGIFFNALLAAILGYSNEAKYDSSVVVSPNGPIGDKKEHPYNGTEKFCLGCGKKLKPGANFCENCGKKVE